MDDDKKEQPLSIIHLDNIEEEIIVRFSIEKGCYRAKDNKGYVKINSKGVKVLTKDKIEIGYGEKIALRISTRNVSEDAFIDFYADDNDLLFYTISDIHCGKVLVKPKKAVCKKIPDAAPENIIGTVNYYKWRFENFMKRHAECSHFPPEYYYGELREKYDSTIKDSEEVYKRLAIRNHIKSMKTSEQIKEEVQNERVEKDNKLPEFKRNGKILVPTPEESYGHKYCDKFTNELMHKLSPAGKEWLIKARLDLQKLMERGVVDKKYKSTYNIYHLMIDMG